MARLLSILSAVFFVIMWIAAILALSGIIPTLLGIMLEIISGSLALYLEVKALMCKK